MNSTRKRLASSTEPRRCDYDASPAAELTQCSAAAEDHGSQGTRGLARPLVWPASNLTQQPPVGQIAMLAQTQALTSASLQLLRGRPTGWMRKWGTSPRTGQCSLGKSFTTSPGSRSGEPTTRRTTWGSRQHPEDECLRPADKKRFQYKSNMDQVWEYLDRAYLRQDTFLHDLMKQVHGRGTLVTRITGRWWSFWLWWSGPSTSPRTLAYCPLCCIRTTWGSSTRSGRMESRPGGGLVQKDKTS